MNHKKTIFGCLLATLLAMSLQAYYYGNPNYGYHSYRYGGCPSCGVHYSGCPECGFRYSGCPRCGGHYYSPEYGSEYEDQPDESGYEDGQHDMEQSQNVYRNSAPQYGAQPKYSQEGMTMSAETEEMQTYVENSLNELNDMDASQVSDKLTQGNFASRKAAIQKLGESFKKEYQKYEDMSQSSDTTDLHDQEATLRKAYENFKDRYESFVKETKQ